MLPTLDLNKYNLISPRRDLSHGLQAVPAGAVPFVIVLVKFRNPRAGLFDLATDDH
jgi:hypothetical protein